MIQLDSGEPRKELELFVRLSDDHWFFFFLTVIVITFFVLVIIVVRVLWRQTHNSDKAQLD